MCQARLQQENVIRISIQNSHLGSGKLLSKMYRDRIILGALDMPEEIFDRVIPIIKKPKNRKKPYVRQIIQCSIESFKDH